MPKSGAPPVTCSVPEPTFAEAFSIFSSLPAIRSATSISETGKGKPRIESSPCSRSKPPAKRGANSGPFTSSWPESVPSARSARGITPIRLASCIGRKVSLPSICGNVARL